MQQLWKRMLVLSLLIWLFIPLTVQAASTTTRMWQLNQEIYQRPKQVSANETAKNVFAKPRHADLQSAQQIYQKYDLNQTYQLTAVAQAQVLMVNRELAKMPHHPWVSVVCLKSLHGQSIQQVADFYLHHNYFGATNPNGLLILSVPNDNGKPGNQVLIKYQNDGLGQQGLQYVSGSDVKQWLPSGDDAYLNNIANFSMWLPPVLAHFTQQAIIDHTKARMKAQSVIKPATESSSAVSSSATTSSVASDSSATSEVVHSMLKIKPTAQQIQQGQQIYQAGQYDPLHRLSPYLMGQIVAINQKWARQPHHPWLLVISKNEHSKDVFAQDTAKPYLKHNPFGATNRYGLVLASVSDEDGDYHFGVQGNDYGLGLMGLRYYTESSSYQELLQYKDQLEDDENAGFQQGLSAVLAFYNYRVLNQVKYPKPSWLVYEYNVRGPQIVFMIVAILLGILGAFMPLWSKLYQRLHAFLFPDAVNYAGDDDKLFVKPHALGNHLKVLVVDDEPHNSGGGFGGGSGGGGGGGGGFGGGGASI